MIEFYLYSVVIIVIVASIVNTKSISIWKNILARITLYFVPGFNLLLVFMVLICIVNLI